MTQTGLSIGIEIKPWQEALYAQMRKPSTLRTVKRLLKSTLRDLDLARRCGDAEAENGVTEALRLVLLELATVEVGTAEAYAAKQALLRQWRDLWTDLPLPRAMIDAALRVDANRLGLPVDIGTADVVGAA